MSQHWETSCVITTRDSKTFQKSDWNRGSSLIYETSFSWTMLEHADYTEIMIFMSQWSGSVDIRRSAQSFKSRSCIILNNLEPQVTTLKKDGSLSWIVIFRGMNKYVEEIFEEKGGKWFQHREPIETKQKGQSGPQSFLVSKICVPIDQR